MSWACFSKVDNVGAERMSSGRLFQLPGDRTSHTKCPLLLSAPIFYTQMMTSCWYASELDCWRVAYRRCSDRWRPDKRWGPWGTAERDVVSSARALRTMCVRCRRHPTVRRRLRCSRWTRSHVSRTCRGAVDRSEPRPPRPADLSGTSRWTPRTDSIRDNLPHEHPHTYTHARAHLAPMYPPELFWT